MNFKRIESSLLFMAAFFASHAVTILIFMFVFDARENSTRLADFILFGVMLGAFLTLGSAVGYVAVTMFLPAVKKLSDIIFVRSGFIAGFAGLGGRNGELQIGVSTFQFFGRERLVVGLSLVVSRYLCWLIRAVDSNRAFENDATFEGA